MVMPVAHLVAAMNLVLLAQQPQAGSAAKEFRKSQEALDYNRIDEAVRHLKKGIALDPKNVDAYNDLGTIYFNTNEPEKAVEAFTKMIELDPRCFRGYLNLAFVFFSQQRYGDAEPAARRAVQLAPSDSRARYLLGASLALGSKKLIEAKEHLSIAAPEMVEARFRLAHVLIDLGDLESGMKEMQLYSIESQPGGRRRTPSLK
jgi:tetratricopeptide (TPR) repeat protein